MGGGVDMYGLRDTYGCSSAIYCIVSVRVRGLGRTWMCRVCAG